MSTQLNLYRLYKDQFITKNGLIPLSNPIFDELSLKLTITKEAVYLSEKKYINTICPDIVLDEHHKPTKSYGSNISSSTLDSIATDVTCMSFECDVE